MNWYSTYFTFECCKRLYPRRLSSPLATAVTATRHRPPEAALKQATPGAPTLAVRQGSTRRQGQGAGTRGLLLLQATRRSGVSPLGNNPALTLDFETPCASPPNTTTNNNFTGHSLLNIFAIHCRAQAFDVSTCRLDPFCIVFQHFYLHLSILPSSNNPCNPRPTARRFRLQQPCFFAIRHPNTSLRGREEHRVHQSSSTIVPASASRLARRHSLIVPGRSQHRGATPDRLVSLPATPMRTFTSP